MGIIIRLPILVMVDNGAISSRNSFALCQRTQYIDISHHFARELIEDGSLEIIVVRSEHNSEDIHTKNTSEETFIKHSQQNLQAVRNINRDNRTYGKKAYSQR
jgi:hypothetical protein